MNIVLPWRVAKQLRDVLSDIDIFAEHKRHNEYSDLDVDLAKLTREECVVFRDRLRTSAIHGTKVMAADIDKYLTAAIIGVDDVQARTVRQAAWLLEHFIAKLPHHLVFSEDDYAGESYVGYFVEDVNYRTETTGSYGGRTPEHVTIELAYVDQDTLKTKDLELFASDVVGMKPHEILRKQGFVPENETLAANLKRETELFYETTKLIGKKYMARGIGVTDLDDASTNGKTYWSIGARSGRVRLDMFDTATPVVVDVLKETDKEKSNERDATVNLYRWHPWNLRFFSPSEDELVRHVRANEDTEFRPELQVPVHPLVPVFDLKRHLRLRVHVNNLVEYAYRREVADGLVIPQRDRDLVELLLDEAGNTFEDVVAGKGGSMNVLSAGPPGTGKTLTAEVFAEFKQRPLFTVQCSQLGLKADDIEKNLAVILGRANRWNAVLLLDEADVYIRRRGTELQQNAIVGVFLRMLEYASCSLFMTTNLPESVDDAIASRCIVMLHYEVPTAEAQTKIWKTLATLNGIKLKDADIATFVRENPRISGRDVKNLLKLASLVAKRDRKPVTIETLRFALAYKPTASVDALVAEAQTLNRRKR